MDRLHDQKSKSGDFNVRSHSLVCSLALAATLVPTPSQAASKLMYQPLRVDYERSCFADQQTKSVAVLSLVYKRTYAQLGGLVDLHAYVFYPPGKSPDQGNLNLPAVAMFHGGGLMGGSPMLWHAQGLRYASEGMIAVAFQYRNYNTYGNGQSREQAQASFDLEPRDAVSAMRWLRKYAPQLGVDPNHVAAVGDSAGGTLATLTGLINQTADDDPADDLRFSSHPQVIMAENPLLNLMNFAPGGAPQTLATLTDLNPESSSDLFNLPEISPLHLMSQSNYTPAMMILQGSEDKIAPSQNANSFCDKENAIAGYRCLSQVYGGWDHNFFATSAEGWRVTIDNSLTFMQWGGFLASPRHDAVVNKNCIYSEAALARANKCYGYSQDRNQPGFGTPTPCSSDVLNAQ